ncbi:MAG: NTP transferase domain-containing protein [Nitrospirae bacterium]|nr:NTP transferase domain-containing protein [Nitrospirota bacterium]
MKAVILAAGMGKRMRSPESGEPKSAKKVLGLPIIKRVILSARRAGIKDFIIVVGYLAERIKEILGDGKDLKVNIMYVENNEWEKGNGVSLLKAKAHIDDDRFILIMGDHLFDPAMIEDIKRIQIKDDEAVLMVDFNPAPCIDLQDATKVKVRDNHIEEISKQLVEYDGVDCGIFLCGKGVFAVLEEEIKRGREGITDAMSVLAMNNKLLSLDSKGRFWLDVDTEVALKNAEKNLLKGLIKPTDGIVSRYINRPISLRISRILVNKTIKPNTISVISFIVSVVSALLFSIGNYFSTLIGGLLVQFSSILDGCDGEVARLKFEDNEYGAWFDATLDRYADAIVIFGIILGLLNYNSNMVTWIYGYLAITGTFITSYTATKYDALLKLKKNTTWRFGRDIRMFIIMIGAVLNEMYYLLIALALLTNIVSLRRLYVFREQPAG